MSCLRSCAPPRAQLDSLKVGTVFVFTDTGHGMQPCPECGHAGAWVRGELRCLVCASRHVPDRAFWQRFDRAVGVERAALAQNVDALQRILPGAKPRRFGWVQ